MKPCPNSFTYLISHSSHTMMFDSSASYFTDEETEIQWDNPWSFRYEVVGGVQTWISLSLQFRLGTVARQCLPVTERNTLFWDVLFFPHSWVVGWCAPTNPQGSNLRVAFLKTTLGWHILKTEVPLFLLIPLALLPLSVSSSSVGWT